MYDEKEVQLIVNDYNEALEELHKLKEDEEMLKIKITKIQVKMEKIECDTDTHGLKITNSNFDDLDFSSFECSACNKKLAGEGNTSQLVIELDVKAKPYSFNAYHHRCVSKWLEGGKV